MVIAIATAAWLLLVCAALALGRAIALDAAQTPHAPEQSPPVWYWQDYRTGKPPREPADEQRGA